MTATLNMADIQSVPGFNSNMLKSLISESEAQLNKNLLPAARMSFIINFLSFAYMVSIIFWMQIAPVLARFKQLFISMFSRIAAFKERFYQEKQK
jgi:hypothetical protein